MHTGNGRTGGQTDTGEAARAAAGDDWTRFSPPPKTRISDEYADPVRGWRRLQAGLALLVSCLLLWAMIAYGSRRDAITPSEPSRIERRTDEAREFLREHKMETAPFTRAQEERARRRGEQGK